jgi:hypothetical protein
VSQYIFIDKFNSIVFIVRGIQNKCSKQHMGAMLLVWAQNVDSAD